LTPWDGSIEVKELVIIGEPLSSIQCAGLKCVVLYLHAVGLGGLVISVLVIGPKVFVFKPHGGRLFKGDKNP
jgi:hypothetical protein